MDDEIRTDIAVIKVRVENMDGQIKRFIAHVESERDVRAEQGKRIDLLAKEIQWMREREQEKERNDKWRIEVIFALLSLIISVTVMLITILK